MLWDSAKDTGAGRILLIEIENYLPLKAIKLLIAQDFICVCTVVFVLWSVYQSVQCGIGGSLKSQTVILKACGDACVDCRRP